MCVLVAAVNGRVVHVQETSEEVVLLDRYWQASLGQGLLISPQIRDATTILNTQQGVEATIRKNCVPGDTARPP